MNALALFTELVERVISKGADHAEVFFEESRVRRVELDHGDLRERTVSVNRGVGIRVIVSGRTGFACASDLRPVALDGLCTDLINLTRMLPSSVPSPLPDKPTTQLWPPERDDEILGLSDADHLKLAKELVAQGLAVSPQVRFVSRALVQLGDRHITLASSLGRLCTYAWTTCSAGIAAVAQGDGNRTLHYVSGTFRRLRDLRAACLGTVAATTAVRLLGGRPLSSRVCNVLFAPSAMAKLLQAIASAFSGEMAARGSSCLAGRVGEKVATSEVTLVDDPCHPNAYGHAPFDHEGTPTQLLQLIHAGRIENLAHHTASAAIMGSESTGNGWRSSYRSPPTVAFANLRLEPGTHDSDQLVTVLRTGLHVLDVAPQGSFHPLTGRLSFGATGLWIEDAEPVHPVRGVTLACDLLGLFGQIRAVGNDLQVRGVVNSPSVLVDGLTVGGLD